MARRGRPSQGSEASLQPCWRHHSVTCSSCRHFPSGCYLASWFCSTIGVGSWLSRNPTAEWIARQLTEACGWEAAGYIVRDRDCAYGRTLSAATRDGHSRPTDCTAIRHGRTHMPNADWLDQAGDTRSCRCAWRASPSAHTSLVHDILQRGPDPSVAEQGRADSPGNSDVGRVSQHLTSADCIPIHSV